MNFFYYTGNDEFEPEFLQYLQRVSDFIRLNYDMEFDKITDGIQDVLGNPDELREFFESDNNPTFLRTLYYLLNIDVELLTGGRGSLLSDIYNRLIGETSSLFNDYESVGESLAEAGIACFHCAWPVIDDDTRKILTQKLYNDEVCSEGFLRHEDTWHSNFCHFLQGGLRYTQLINDNDFNRINHDSVDIPAELEVLVREDFFLLPPEKQSSLFKRAIAEIERIDKNTPNWNPDCSWELKDLIRAWPLEYGRLKLIMGVEVEDVVSQVIPVMDLLATHMQMSESERNAVIEISLRAMLLPFPDAFTKTFPGISIEDALCGPESGSVNLSKGTSAFKYYPIQTLMDWHGVLPFGGKILSYLSACGVKYEAQSLAPIIEQSDKFMHTVIDLRHKVDSRVFLDLIRIWIKKDHFHGSDRDHLRAIMKIDCLEDAEDVHGLNVMKMGIYLRNLESQYFDVSMINIDLTVNDIKDRFIESALEKGWLNSHKVLSKLGLGWDDLAPYSDRLDPVTKRVLISTDLSI